MKVDCAIILLWANGMYTDMEGVQFIFGHRSSCRFIPLYSGLFFVRVAEQTARW
jgi:hypothetical protein